MKRFNGSVDPPSAECLWLRGAPAPGMIVPIEKQAGTWDAFIWVNDAQALYAEFIAKGADIVYGPVI